MITKLVIVLVTSAPRLNEYPQVRIPSPRSYPAHFFTRLHRCRTVSNNIYKHFQTSPKLTSKVASTFNIPLSGRLFERCSHNSPTVAKPGSVPNSTNSPNEVRGSSFTGSMTNDKEYEETLYLSIITYQRSQTSPKQHSYFNLQSMLRLEVLSADLLIAGHGQRLGGGGHKRSL